MIVLTLAQIIGGGLIGMGLAVLALKWIYRKK